jgi:hypothetical protein
MFLIDICQIFNTSYFDENFNLVQDRKVIAKTYIGSWFLIDVIAIIPFDIFMGNSNSINEIVRITRIGRMYKLVKLTKLFKIFKIMKEKNKMFKYLQQFTKIKYGLDRLIAFFFSFFIMVHLVCCIWVMMANFNAYPDDTWMGAGGYFELSAYEQYLTSFYFTITTITTVGYGDITISTWQEKAFCTLMMITGVITFSFASGSLASIIQSIDNQNAHYKQ